jgi:hypothetical protein
MPCDPQQGCKIFTLKTLSLRDDPPGDGVDKADGRFSPC